MIHKYKYCRIIGEKLVCSNRVIEPYLNCYNLEDVTLDIKDNGTLIVTGSLRIYDYYNKRTKEKNWEHEPEDTEIKIGYTTFTKYPYYYLEGIVRTKILEPIIYTLTEYIIVIEE